MEPNDFIGDIDMKHLVLSIIFWTSIMIEYYYKIKKKESKK